MFTGRLAEAATTNMQRSQDTLYALAADTGGAIKGRRLDLCFDSTREARAWGRQKVRALVLGWMPRGKARKALQAAGLEPE